MKKTRLLVIDVAVNIGVLVWSFLAHVGGLPVTRLVPLTLFSVVVLNVLVWAIAKFFVRSSEGAGRQARAGEEASRRPRRFRLFALVMIAVGIPLCLLGLWPRVNNGRLDISSVCMGGIFLAQGIFLLLYSKQEGPPK